MTWFREQIEKETAQDGSDLGGRVSPGLMDSSEWLGELQGLGQSTLLGGRRRSNVSKGSRASSAAGTNRKINRQRSQQEIVRLGQKRPSNPSTSNKMFHTSTSAILKQMNEGYTKTPGVEIIKTQQSTDTPQQPHLQKSLFDSSI